MALAWRTFLKYEAPVCSPEGVGSFYRFVTSVDLEKMFLIGEYKAFGAFEDGKIVGISGVRSGNLLSILFVDGEHQHKGIATSLVVMAGRFIRDVNKKDRMMVYAATGAIGFYERLGFVKTGSMRQEAGIEITPMEVGI